MVLNRDAIAALIPHQGAMCLLEEVLSNDDEGIVCRAVSHRDAGHPLREDGVLPAVCGIEYAAQAMAVHGALMGRAAGGSARRGGMLAAARDVVFSVDRLDDIADDLVVSARRLVAEEGWLLYEFALHAGAKELVRGRAAVSLAGERRVKRALVTGGSGAIGGAVCRDLARRGMHVIVHAHGNPERARDLAAEIVSGGGRAEAVRFDVTSYTEASRALEALLATDAIQILVHSAGISADGPLAGMSESQWQDVIGVSLNGFFNVARPLLLPMLRTRWGRIVAVSSVAGIMGNRGQANYAAAKAGLHGAVKSLALESGSRGVTVNAVAPGIIASLMTGEVFSAEDIARMVPMKRAGTPGEVAALIGFLCSDEASYISGQVISVNGGMA